MAWGGGGGPTGASSVICRGLRGAAIPSRPSSAPGGTTSPGHTLTQLPASHRSPGPALCCLGPQPPHCPEREVMAMEARWGCSGPWGAAQCLAAVGTCAPDGVPLSSFGARPPQRHWEDRKEQPAMVLGRCHQLSEESFHCAPPPAHACARLTSPTDPVLAGTPSQRIQSIHLSGPADYLGCRAELPDSAVPKPTSQGPLHQPRPLTNCCCCFP